MDNIKRIHWSAVPTNKKISCFAIWPEPVDYDLCFEKAGFNGFDDFDDLWDSDFELLLSRLFAELSNLGTPRLSSGELPVLRYTGWFRRKKEVGSLFQALLFSTHDDQFPTCTLDFGQPSRARVTSSDGHPILWIELVDNATFSEILRKVACDIPCFETSLDWKILLPDSIK